MPLSRLLPLLAVACLALAVSAADGDDIGVLPVGADGKPLNLDFETGTLKDWTATGDAFKGQPIKGDTVAPRRSDMRSRHQGNYWIGTYERQGDRPQGTLTSASFKITHPYASFLVGGGPHATTCVELVLKETGQVFHRASGLEEEDLKREVVDLGKYRGKEMFIRLVDRHTGHWGHVNFDDFRFHAKKPAFAARPKQALQPDVYAHAGLPPQKAASVMTVPEGFKVTLFAGEPDVRQPIAFCLDDRGRLWVAEAYCYPVRRSEKEAKDRILIFEDTDGDGVFDKRTVFLEGLNLVSGLEVGFGGVWIGAAPQLLFVPVKPGEDKPAGKPQVLLDGWGYDDTHETLNTFTWGPDGWLYGCHGVFTHSRVGKPGTPRDKRVPINAGIWRYHPTKHVFEVFAHGTSNPWGLDFNDFGQLFCEACVIPHNWHIIQGGRYHRQAGSHFNPYTYADIQTIAVHRHYLGNNPHGGNEKSDSAGGGHAHCGTMIYKGGRWPAKYRGQMFMGNIHGRRLNVDVLTPQGSGYVASRAPDFLLANDAWARFINLQTGPDGNAYLIDWYDQQACHVIQPQVWDRTNGRIYKISYGDNKPVSVDLGKATPAELVKLQLHENDWYARHARRLLQERYSIPVPPGADNTASRGVNVELEKIAFGHADKARRLRGLWALHATGGLTTERIAKGLEDKGPHVRAWTIQLALEDAGRAAGFIPAGINPAARPLLTKLEVLAKDDPSPVVRLYLASALQRLPLDQRWNILGALVAHGEDSGDHNLPLMYWYAAEPLAEVDAARALELAASAKVPTLLPFMVRRISALGTGKAIALLVAALAKADGDARRLVYLRGIQDGLKGQRNFPMPAGWRAAAAKLMAGSPEVRNRAVALAVLFGDKEAFRELRRVLGNVKADARLRRDALAALVDARDELLPPVLHDLVRAPELRSEVIRALAGFDDKKTPGILVDLYPSLDSAGKRAVVNTLSSRPAHAKELLDAIAAKKVPAADLSAEVVRQLRNLGDAALEKRINEVWGVVRTTPAERQALIKQYVSLLKRPKYSPDVALGRALFQKTCAQCHTLFGEGGKVGPDITGANRGSLDYLMENILDPGAVIPKEYAMTVLNLYSGRVISGIVKEENDKTLTVVNQNETLTVAKKDVEKREASAQSMMPDDLLKGLSEYDVQALVAYLQSPAQTPMLATPDNAKDLFNGKDLTGWVGNPKLWRVEGGEIIGTSPGIPHNEFLRSRMVAADFTFSVKVKLTPNKENSGIQFRSEELPGGEVKGPQADVGAGWWGKLYEEHGRGLLWKESGEKHVKADDWNDYVIEAQGSRVRTWINGKLCVDLDDARLARRGIFAFQIHSGGAMEVRFKDLKLEVPGKK
jgi:putative membrane-bound dehydrogenase-like protein